MEDGSDILNWFLPIFERAKIEDILDPKLQGIFKNHSASLQEVGSMAAVIDPN